MAESQLSLGVNNGVNGRPCLPPIVQINDLAQVCRTAIWSVLKEKHYLLKFPPCRKQGMTAGSERLHMRARPSSEGTDTQSWFMLGDLERLPGGQFRHSVCELVTAVKLGKGSPSPQNTVCALPRSKHPVHGVAGDR